MRYRTGDIAELMGITNMGVIYLEKRGILHSDRQENGYRTFELDEVTKLGIIRSYEKLGFSLEEALTIITLPEGEVKAILERRKKELRAQMDMLQFMEEFSCAEIVGERELSRENTQFVISPAMYYFPVWEDLFAAGSLNREQERQLRKTDVSWISAMPYMRYCSKFSQIDGQWEGVRGNCIQVEHAQDHEVFLNEWVELVPPRYCLRYYDETEDLKAALAKGIAYLEKLGLAWEPEAFLPLSLRYRGELRRRVCVYLPLKEGEKSFSS